MRGNFFICWKPFSFSRRTLLHGVSKNKHLLAGLKLSLYDNRPWPLKPKNAGFISPKALRSTLEPTQSQRQCEPEFFRGDKAIGAWTLPFRLDVVLRWIISGALSTLLKYAFITSWWTIFLCYTAIETVGLYPTRTQNYAWTGPRAPSFRSASPDLILQIQDESLNALEIYHPVVYIRKRGKDLSKSKHSCLYVVNVIKLTTCFGPYAGPSSGHKMYNTTWMVHLKTLKCSFAVTDFRVFLFFKVRYLSLSNLFHIHFNSILPYTSIHPK
jgi:hypothetical protein